MKTNYNNSFLIIGGDSFLITVSWIGSFLLRYNFVIPSERMSFIFPMVPLVLIVKLIIFYCYHLYRGMWRYTSIDDLISIIKASGISFLLLFFISMFIKDGTAVEQSIFIIDGILTILFISGFRLSIRMFFTYAASHPNRPIASYFFPYNEVNPKDSKNLIIIGAGDCAEKIFREIRDNPRLNYHVVGFVDDDPEKIGKYIHGVPVVGKTDILKELVSKTKAEEILIAIPSATSKQMRQIVERCKETGIPYKTVPGMGELIEKKVSIKRIRDVDYTDLLGREVVRLQSKQIGSYIQGSKILVTGAGGSIGSELCRQICKFKPSRLILYERAESPLYDIEMELKNDFPGIQIIPLLADICNLNMLHAAFDKYSPQVIFHAAAYKHVPMLEIYPWQAVMNNIIGTRNVVNMANEYSVERFVFVSTDKAVNPTNVMGTSKRIAEMLIQSQNGCGLSKTRFLTVRFGNVVGSAGSVIPLFKKQIEKGGPITVTHPEVTRYFMTIPEACQLILQAASMGNGGEIFILDMGQPIKILDMAKDLIRFSGLEPEIDIPIQIIGLRPGEKLVEELITSGEGILPTNHEKIMVLRGLSCNPSLLNGNIDRLAQLAQEQNGTEIRKLFKKIVPEYQYNPTYFN